MISNLLQKKQSTHLTTEEGMTDYYYDLRDRRIVPEEFTNPWSPSDRYILLEAWQLRQLIDWVKEDDEKEANK